MTSNGLAPMDPGRDDSTATVRREKIAVDRADAGRTSRPRRMMNRLPLRKAISSTAY